MHTLSKALSLLSNIHSDIFIHTSQTDETILCLEGLDILNKLTSPVYLLILVDDNLSKSNSVSILFDIKPLEIAINAPPNKKPILENNLGFISISHCIVRNFREY